MDFNSQDFEDVLEPEIPEGKNSWTNSEQDELLRGFNYISGGKQYAHLRSEGLEGLVAYSREELLDFLDEEYNLKYNAVDVSKVEYGNGWALIEFE